MTHEEKLAELHAASAIHKAQKLADSSRINLAVSTLNPTSPMTPTNPAVPAATEPKHTPGPWHISGGMSRNAFGYHGFVIVPNCKPQHYVAICEETPATQIGSVVSKITDQDARANARLISVAPDLLAALTACLPDLKHYAATHGSGPDRRLADAIAAISRATS